MDRRRFLALSGLCLTGVAGCTAENDQQRTTAVPTTSPEYDLDIEFSGLQSGVVELFEDAYELSSNPSSQYLFLNVSVTSGLRPAVEDIIFRFDGEAYPPKTEWDYPPLH
jgi:hypothetical protein